MSNLRSLTFDAIIIGGGGSGLRAALELAKSGKKTAVLSKVSGFLRSKLARASTMRTVPRISFRFDESVGRGRDMETLLREARRADEQLHTGDSEDASETAD